VRGLIDEVRCAPNLADCADIGEGKKRKHNEMEDTDEIRQMLSGLERDDDRQVDRVIRECMRKRLLLLAKYIDILSQADIENQLGTLQRHVKALAIERRA